MSVEFVTGTMGSGKSLYSMQYRIIPALLRGSNVVTNITGISLSRVFALFADPSKHSLQEFESRVIILDDEQSIRFWEHSPVNSLILIDEVQKYHSKHDYNKQDTKDMIVHLTLSRKYGHEIVFVTQHIENVISGARNVCELTHVLRGMHIYGGSKSKVVHRVFDRDNFIGDTGLLKKYSWEHDKKIYMCYESYSFENVTDVKKGVNIFANKKLIALLVLLLIIFLKIIFGFKKYSKSKDIADKVVKTESHISTNSITSSVSNSMFGNSNNYIFSPPRSLEIEGYYVKEN